MKVYSVSILGFTVSVLYNSLSTWALKLKTGNNNQESPQNKDHLIISSNETQKYPFAIDSNDFQGKESTQNKAEYIEMNIMTKTNKKTHTQMKSTLRFPIAGEPESYYDLTGSFLELKTMLLEAVLGLNTDGEKYIEEIRQTATDSATYTNESISETLDVFQNKETDTLTILQRNSSKVIITFLINGKGSVTLFKDNATKTMEFYMENDNEKKFGLIIFKNGAYELLEQPISNIVGPVLLKSVVFDGIREVGNLIEGLFKKRLPGPKGGDKTSFLGRCPGFERELWTPFNFFGGAIYYQGPLDNGFNSQDVEKCFVELQEKFKPGLNPLDKIWPQPRECLTNTINICECSLDTVPKIQYAFPDERQGLYDNAVEELRDFTQGYLPRKGAAYGAMLTASYSCDVQPGKPDQPEYKLEYVIDYMVKGLRITEAEED